LSDEIDSILAPGYDSTNSVASSDLNKAFWADQIKFWFMTINNYDYSTEEINDTGQTEIAIDFLVNLVGAYGYSSGEAYIPDG
jgi:hypothetical protein